MLRLQPSDEIAEKQENGEITDEQAAALLPLILQQFANEGGNADASSDFSPDTATPATSEDEVMDMVIDHSINPVGTIDYTTDSIIPRTTPQRAHLHHQKTLPRFSSSPPRRCSPGRLQILQHG